MYVLISDKMGNPVLENILSIFSRTRMGLHRSPKIVSVNYLLLWWLAWPILLLSRILSLIPAHTWISLWKRVKSQFKN